MAAEEARVRFKLERVVFVPNGRPPHKKNYEVTAAEQRYEMTFLATANNAGFETSRMELDREGPSYSVDTVAQFRRRFGSDTRLYFITGADAMLEFMTWHEPDRLAAMCEFVAVVRPGYDLRRLEEALGTRIMPRCRVLETPGVDISSTELRRRAASGESLRYLTPPSVERYIRGRRVYAGRDTRGSVA
jgi:nicotinate-nucleotide adenylyltransferase